MEQKRRRQHHHNVEYIVKRGEGRARALKQIKPYIPLLSRVLCILEYLLVILMRRRVKPNKSKIPQQQQIFVVFILKKKTDSIWWRT